MAKTLENGSFQDPRGNAVNAGTVEFVLSQDAMIIAGGQVAPTLVSTTLTATGDMPGSFTMLANDELTPSGTFYLVTVFDSNGARVFGPERWVLSGASPIDLDTLTPTIVDPAFADPILANPTASQTIVGFPLITDISTAASVTSNTARLLHVDNTDNSHTGDTSITNLASFTLPADTMGTTGRLIIEATGTVTGSAGSKTIQLDFGATTVFTTGLLAGTGDWFVRVIVSNTATGSQRLTTEANTHNSTTLIGNYTSMAVDTTASVTIRCRVTLADAADTVTQTKFEIQTQQV